MFFGKLIEEANLFVKLTLLPENLHLALAARAKRIGWADKAMINQESERHDGRKSFH